MVGAAFVAIATAALALSLASSLAARRAAEPPPPRR
jgi:hypothetical protein